MIEIFRRRFYCVRSVLYGLIVLSFLVLEAFDDSDV